MARSDSAGVAGVALGRVRRPRAAERHDRGCGQLERTEAPAVRQPSRAGDFAVMRIGIQPCSRAGGRGEIAGRPHPDRAPRPIRTTRFGAGPIRAPGSFREPARNVACRAKRRCRA